MIPNRLPAMVYVYDVVWTPAWNALSLLSNVPRDTPLAVLLRKDKRSLKGKRKYVTGQAFRGWPANGSLR